MTHRRQVKTLPDLREISEYFSPVRDNIKTTYYIYSFRSYDNSHFT